MVQITKNQLKEILMNVDTPTFISFISDTPEDMNKYLDYWIINNEGKRKKNPNPTPNPYYELGIRKVSKKYRIITGFDYEKSVNRRLEKEGKEPNFESKENWFNVVSKGLVVNKNDDTKFYIRYQFQKDSTLESTSYYQNNPIDVSMYEHFLREKSNYENQGLENTLNFQVCSLDNIRQISIDKEQYEIIG